MPAACPGNVEDLQVQDFRTLAEWRYQIRKFLSFSEEAARSIGIEPQQHQVLLAIKGLPEGMLPTVGVIAERIAVRPHTLVELVDRLVQRGLARRQQCSTDRRAVLIVLTERAEWMLRRLSDQHRRQLRIVGPALLQAIAAILAGEDAPAEAPPPGEAPDGEQREASE